MLIGAPCRIVIRPPALLLACALAQLTGADVILTDNHLFSPVVRMAPSFCVVLRLPYLEE